jgi:hypothetical protein
VLATKEITSRHTVGLTRGILLANPLQSSRSTFSRESFPSFFAFKEGMWDTQISALLSSPTVSQPFSRLYPSQNDHPVAPVKKNPLKRLFLTKEVGEKRAFLRQQPSLTHQHMWAALRGVGY